jgi:hypothetical protein
MEVSAFEMRLWREETISWKGHGREGLWSESKRDETAVGSCTLGRFLARSSRTGLG